jgi:DEAD/DEAH box helicase domain-containing protein
LPWPQHFRDLEKTHAALNLVYTFCSSRKHFATTYNNLKSAVENNTKKPLTITEIVQLKYLLPNRINFAYVDESMLQVYVAGPEKQLVKKKGKKWSELEDIYQDPTFRNTPKQQVLFFEYLDADVKTEAGGMYVSCMGCKTLADKRNSGTNEETD